MHLLGIGVSILLLAEFALLHYEMINFKLPGGSLDDFFFNGTFCHQPIYYNLAFLSDTMSAINCLEINLGVPIRIENDDDVCRVKVDT